MTTDVIVIGAGLSGASCAHELAQRGLSVLVVAQDGGASALPVGLLAAHLTAQDLPASVRSREGISCTLSHAEALLELGQDWQPTIVRQRLLDKPEKNERMLNAARQLPQWFAIDGADVLHLKSAWIKPSALVTAWLKHPLIERRMASAAQLKSTSHAADPLWQVSDAQGQLIAQAPQIVIAAATGSASLLATAGIQITLGQVDGQVAWGAWPPHPVDPVDPTNLAEPPKTPQPVNGHGHFVPAVPHLAMSLLQGAAQFWLSGSTYERQDSAQVAPAQAPQAKAKAPELLSLQAQGLQANRLRLRQLLSGVKDEALSHDVLSALEQQFERGEVAHWQGSRCTTSDRLPAVGRLAPGLYACTGMGSRGLSYAPWCAQQLVREMLAPSDQEATDTLTQAGRLVRKKT